MSRQIPLNTPAQTYCSVCGELFVYFRKGNPRQHCDPCIVTEAREANRFYNRLRGLRNAAARGDANQG